MRTYAQCAHISTEVGFDCEVTMCCSTRKCERNPCRNCKNILQIVFGYVCVRVEVQLCGKATVVIYESRKAICLQLDAMRDDIA